MSEYKTNELACWHDGSRWTGSLMIISRGSTQNCTSPNFQEGDVQFCSCIPAYIRKTRIFPGQKTSRWYCYTNALRNWSNLEVNANLTIISQKTAKGQHTPHLVKQKNVITLNARTFEKKKCVRQSRFLTEHLLYSIDSFSHRSDQRVCKLHSSARVLNNFIVKTINYL